MRNDLGKAAVLVGAVLLVSACTGGGADLPADVAAHLEDYERLIEEFEPRFEDVRDDPSRFAGVADSYRRKAAAWIGQWKTLATDLTDEQGRAVRARVDRLNRRAKAMLTGR